MSKVKKRSTFACDGDDSAVMGDDFSTGIPIGSHLRHNLHITNCDGADVTEMMVQTLHAANSMIKLTHVLRITSISLQTQSNYHYFPEK